MTVFMFIFLHSLEKLRYIKCFNCLERYKKVFADYIPAPITLKPQPSNCMFHGKNEIGVKSPLKLIFGKV